MESTKHCFRYFPRVEGESTTQPCLQASCTFPIPITEETLPFGPAMITHFRRATSSFLPKWATSRVPQGLGITDMSSCQGTNQNTGKDKNSGALGVSLLQKQVNKKKPPHCTPAQGYITPGLFLFGTYKRSHFCLSPELPAHQAPRNVVFYSLLFLSP